MSEVETLILNKNSDNIRFDKEMAKKSRKIFLLTTNFYNKTNDTAILVPKKWKAKGKVGVHLEGTRENDNQTNQDAENSR